MVSSAAKPCCINERASRRLAGTQLATLCQYALGPHPPSAAHALTDALDLLGAESARDRWKRERVSLCSMDGIRVYWSTGGDGMAMCFRRRDLGRLAAAIMGGMAELIDRPSSMRGSSSRHGGASMGENGFSAVKNNNPVSEPGASTADRAGAVTYFVLVPSCQ